MGPAHESDSKRAPLRVLVADDDFFIRKLLKLSLERCGFAVTIAENGEIAFDLWRRAAFDLIIMDLRMPVLGGCEAARQIRSEEMNQGRKPVPIIALTAVYHELVPETYETCGMNDILPKPIAGEALCGSAYRNIAA